MTFGFIELMSVSRALPSLPATRNGARWEEDSGGVTRSPSYRHHLHGASAH